MPDSLEDHSQMNNMLDSLDDHNQGWEQTKRQHAFLGRPIAWISREESEKMGPIYYEQTIQKKETYLEW